MCCPNSSRIIKRLRCLRQCERKPALESDQALGHKIENPVCWLPCQKHSARSHAHPPSSSSSSISSTQRPAIRASEGGREVGRERGPHRSLLADCRPIVCDGIASHFNPGPLCALILLFVCIYESIELQLHLQLHCQLGMVGASS